MPLVQAVQRMDIRIGMVGIGTLMARTAGVMKGKMLQMNVVQLVEEEWELTLNIRKVNYIYLYYSQQLLRVCCNKKHTLFT
jgi:hypothetical protein